MSEARVIGRDKVIAIGEPREQGIEHREEDGSPCNRRSVGASFGPLISKDVVRRRRVGAEDLLDEQMFEFGASHKAARRSWSEN